MTSVKPDLDVDNAPETMVSTTSPESGTSDESLQYEGTTTFSSTTYRYSLMLKSGNLRIWFEDCESKEQWCTTKLSLEDYVDSTNAIPNATASDYVKYFYALLDAASETGDRLVTSQRLKGDVLQLKLTVKFQVLMQSLATTYTFDLKPISLEKVDVLESKLRDVKEEVDALRDESEDVTSTYKKETKELQIKVNKLEGDLGKREVEVSQLKQQLATQDEAVSSNLLGITKKGDLVLWGSDTAVKVPIPGTYQVTVVVNYQSTKNSAMIELQKNSMLLQSVYAGSNQGHPNSSTLMAVTSMDKNDVLAVKCNNHVMLVGSSYLMLVRIGKEANQGFNVPPKAAFPTFSFNPPH